MATRIKLNPEAAKLDNRAMEATLEVGREIARDANANSDAPIGIVAHFIGSGANRRVRIGPRGAAAIVVEYGGAKHEARRPVKRALDKHRIR